MHSYIRRDPAPSAEVHPDRPPPVPLACLNLDHLWPELCDPPPTAKGFVLVWRKRIWGNIRRLTSQNIGFCPLIDEKSGKFRFTQHPAQGQLGKLAFRFRVTAPNIGVDAGEPNLPQVLRVVVRVSK